MSIDPDLPDQRVRVIDDPGREGVTTGRSRSTGPVTMVEVDFGRSGRVYKPLTGLEFAEAETDPLEGFATGVFSGPQDLRRRLTYEKLRGQLTNVFYSMEASNTDFYPHQFKPVLTFVESALGRLLIADEVGLGKTIEAGLIYQELQAREDARRLLVICPSMLREKWRQDLKTKFNIEAKVVNARELVQELALVAQGASHQSFALIGSIEGLRPPKDDLGRKPTEPRVALKQMLEEQVAMGEDALFNLAVIDEAHYLRNQSTAANRLGRLVADAAGNLLLLTATPIQLGSENLYQLLRLVDPDYFTHPDIFEVLLNANKPIMKTLRALWASIPRLEEAREGIDEAVKSREFSEDRVLLEVKRRLDEQGDTVSHDDQIALARMLETRSLLSRYMVRSRKRDVLEKRVIREANALTVELKKHEHELYWRVTRNIRERSRETGQFGAFRLIARQRQLASCMPAAVKAWQEKGLFDEYLNEYLWEDLGFPEDYAESLREDADDLDENDLDIDLDLSDLSYEFLCRHDSKYAKLREWIAPRVSEGEKVVVFAFFRGTIYYLAERLREDGIECAVLLGGMGDEKYDTIDAFAQEYGPSVLLSTEVGSEGIDLQFCRIIVNYDLPWNPMRVEQRIGRLDRLGQQSEKIRIMNLFLEGTIEDRVLQRLYQRLRVFEESIGDLEEVIGERTSEVLHVMLDPDLTEQQREEQAEQTASAIVKNRAMQDDLEQQAVNLIGFTDYLLDTIQQGRERHRWVSPADLVEFVEDFFDHSYPGTQFTLKDQDNGLAELRLSTEAATSLGNYVKQKRPTVSTSIQHGAKAHTITFNPKAVKRARRQPEIITLKHPLISWITSHYELKESEFYPACAAIVPQAEVDVPAGDYVLVIKRWQVRGLRNRIELAYQAAEVQNGTMLSGDESEQLSSSVARSGSPFQNAFNRNVAVENAVELVQECSSRLDLRFDDFCSQIELENEALCDQEERAARAMEGRRVSELRERIQRYREQQRHELIPMTEGLIRREQALLEEKLSRVNKRRVVDPEYADLVSVLIRVE